MIIRLLDQKHCLEKYLDFYKEKDVAFYRPEKLTPKQRSIQFPCNWSQRQMAEKSFFDYSIFPYGILIGYGEWRRFNRSMEIGDTIVQQAYLPPGVRLSQKLIFGVRVNRVWTGENEFGFSYETLEGHPELGESQFIIRRQGDNCVFTISTISVPGNLVSRMVASFFTLPYQAYCTRKALEFVRNSFSGIA